MKKLQESSVSHYLIIFLLTFYAVIPSISIYTQKTDIKRVEKAYSQSQYVMGEASPQKIDDDTLYVYAGYAYMKGEDPTTINFEHPPFGKYLIGLSYKLFVNSFLINIPIFFLILILLYEIQKKLKVQGSLKYIPLIFMATSNMVRDHLGRGLLDLQQLAFSLIFFNILLGKNKYKYVYLGLVSGLIASIKYPFPLMGLFALIILIESLINKRLIKALLSILIGVGAYLVTYVVYFLNNHNLMDFVKFEWYRFKWWTEFRTIPPFLLLDIIFTGRFQAWWDESLMEVARNFTAWWSILFTVNIFSIPFVVKRFPKMFYLVLYSTILLLLYLFGSASNERYLIQLIPFWTINIAMIASHLNIYLNRKIRN